MAELLKLPQLVDQHRVAEMQIRRGRIETGLDPQRTAGFELLDEFGFDDQLVAAALDDFQLFFDFHCQVCSSGRNPTAGCRFS